MTIKPADKTAFFCAAYLNRDTTRVFMDITSNKQGDAVKAGYKQTEVGVIPDDWGVISINELVEKGFIYKPLDGNHGEIHPKGEDFVAEGIPFIMANNVYNESVDLNSCHFIRKEQADNLQKGFSITGDVLFTHKGTVGNVAIVEEISTEYIMLTPQVTYYRVRNHDEVCNAYIKQYFLSNIFQRIVKNISGGGTRAYIGITSQRQLPFILAPIKEQTAIAKALSDTDALIQSLSQLIAKKRQIKQGTMQQLLNPYDGGGALKEGWRLRKLGTIASFYKGNGLPKSALFLNGKNKCIHYGELFTKYSEYISSIISKTDSFEFNMVSQENDVLMPTSDVTPNGLATASCIKENGVILGGDILIIRARPNLLDGIFFSYLINIERDQIMQLVSGSTVYHLYGSDMATFEFGVPEDINKQTQIAKTLSDIDTEITNLENKRAKYQQIKQGMIQNLLTGRIRLI